MSGAILAGAAKSIEAGVTVGRIAGRWRGVRTAVAAMSALFGMLAATPAVSQTTATVITPLTTQPDVNNVNIGNGLIRIDVPSISAPAAPRLKFDNMSNAVPYLRANLSGTNSSI